MKIFSAKILAEMKIMLTFAVYYFTNTLAKIP